MFGISAFSQTPISATAEAALPLVVLPIGAIGASPIGVYAIGQASITTGGEAGVDATAEATGVTLTVSSPVASLAVSAIASATLPTITISSPAVSATGNAVASANGSTVTVSAPLTNETVVEVPLATPAITVGSPVSEASGGATASSTSNTVPVSAPVVSATATSSAVASASLPVISVSAPLTNETVVEVPLATPAISVIQPENNNVVSQVTTRDNARLTVTETYGGFGRFNYKFYDAPNETDYYQVVNKDLSRALNVRTGTTRLLLEVLSLNADGSVDSVVGSYEDVNLPLNVQSYFFEYTGQATLDVYAFTLTARTSDYVWTIYKSAVNLTTGSIGSWQETTDYDFTDTPTSPDFITINSVPRYTVPFRGQSPSDGVVRNHVIYLYAQGTVTPYRFDIIDKTGTLRGSYAFSTSTARNNEVLKYINGTYPNEAVDVAYQNLNDKVPLAIWDGVSSEAQQSSLLSDVYEEVLRTSLIETNYEGTALGIDVDAPVVVLAVTGTASIPAVTIISPVGVATGGAASTATAILPQITVSAPAPANVVSSTAQPVLPSITVGAPLTTETVVEIPIANPPITVSAPAATLAVTSTASAQLVVVTTTAPQATLSASSTAAATLVTITVSPAQSETTLDVLVEATLPAVTVTAPETIEVVIEQVALPQVTLTPAEATLSGSAVATYALTLIDASAPQADTTAAGNVDTAIVTITVGVPGVNAVGTSGGTASASLPEISITAPTSVAVSSSTAASELVQITVSAPIVVIVSDTLTETITTIGADTVICTSSVSGTLTLVVELGASSSGSTTLLSSPSLTATASGSVSTASTVQANAGGVFVVSGDQISGTTQVSGEAARIKNAVGSSQGSTTTSGSCTIVKDTGASVSSSSTVTGSCVVFINLNGNIASTTTVTGAVSFVVGLQGSTAGSTSTSANAFVTTPLVAGDISELRTVLIAEDPPRVTVIQNDIIRYVTVLADVDRTVRITG